jgi:hypothetical protein
MAGRTRKVAHLPSWRGGDRKVWAAPLPSPAALLRALAGFLGYWHECDPTGSSARRRGADRRPLAGLTLTPDCGFKRHGDVDGTAGHERTDGRRSQN